MKKTTYVVAMAFFALITLAGCIEIEEPAPAQGVTDLKATVQGKWQVNKISYKLCRENICNTTQYTGTSQDYFEFTADSAFLVHKDEMNVQQKTRFKADYTRRDAVILSTDSWSGSFVITALAAGKLTLKNEFSGRDPAAVFTDTYYLYK